jgi:hypothetical protein
MPLLGSKSFTTAITGSTTDAVEGLGKVGALNLICAFTAAGGGTTCIVRVGTTLDGGVAFYDIARFDFTTSTAVKRCSIDGRAAAAVAALAALGSEGKIDGLIGDALRIEVTTTGTFTAGSKVEVYYQTKD